MPAGWPKWLGCCSASSPLSPSRSDQSSEYINETNHEEQILPVSYPPGDHHDRHPVYPTPQHHPSETTLHLVAPPTALLCDLRNRTPSHNTLYHRPTLTIPQPIPPRNRREILSLCGNSDRVVPAAKQIAHHALRRFIRTPVPVSHSTRPGFCAENNQENRLRKRLFCAP